LVKTNHKIRFYQSAQMQIPDQVFQIANKCKFSVFNARKFECGDSNRTGQHTAAGCDAGRCFLTSIKVYSPKQVGALESSAGAPPSISAMLCANSAIATGTLVC